MKWIRDERTGEIRGYFKHGRKYNYIEFQGSGWNSGQTNMMWNTDGKRFREIEPQKVHLSFTIRVVFENEGTILKWK